MNGKHSELSLSQRLEAMAIMHLTERSDLIVRREARRRDDPIWHLTVEIQEGGRPVSWKRFGVYLQGSVAPVTAAGARGKVKLSIRRFFEDYGDPLLPFCLFYFTMVDDRGYLAWVAEPVVKAGRPHLKYHREKADCGPIDLRALDSVVGAVESYYSAIKADAIVAG